MKAMHNDWCNNLMGHEPCDNGKSQLEINVININH